MKNSPLHTLLIDVLARYESIVFALLFGSQCSGNVRFDSDIDIALYFEELPDLLINHDRDRYEAFKHRSYIDYFDFEPVMLAQNQKLIEELNYGNFGKAKRAREVR